MDLEIGCLLMDKGFSGIAVLEYLEGQACQAIIACPIRGKEAPTATRALGQG